MSLNEIRAKGRYDATAIVGSFICPFVDGDTMMCILNPRLMAVVLILGLGWQQPATADFLLGAPTRFGPEVNSSSSDITPSLSSDNLTMYFSSNRPGGVGNQSLWQVTRENLDAPWGSPENLSIIGGAYSESPSISADGLQLYFADGWSNGGIPRPNGQGGVDIWVSKRDTLRDQWGEPENLGPTINSSSAEDTPFISFDGLSLYFGSNRRDGSGGNDLYVSKRQSLGDSWGVPRNLGPAVNSPSDEWMDGVTSDGLALFFESLRPGSVGLAGDLYVSMRTSLEEDFGSPVKLPQSVNTSADAWGLTTSADDSAFYYNVGHGNSVDLWKVPLLPFESVYLDGGGDTYVEDFDKALGADGNTTDIAFPRGWTTSESGVFFSNDTTESFPVGSSFVRNSIFNAGAEDSPDRTLAIGLTGDSDQRFLQLLAEVTGSNANTFQLQFDVEAWDARDGIFVPQLNRVLGEPDDPGEVAFNVTVDINTGNGFTSFVDFGTITTGATLEPVFDGIVDGNADANRVSFDSGVLPTPIPAGAQLRVRWEANTEVDANGWVFGLDNVALRMFGTGSQTADFNGDGKLDVADLDALIAGVSAPMPDAQFDLDGNGAVNNADVSQWLVVAATTNGLTAPYLQGDSNLDGSVNSSDLNNLALNWQQDVPRWSGGDFTADGRVNAADLNELGLNWQQSIPLAASQIVPEPSGLMLLFVAGLLTFVSRFKNLSDE